MTAFATMNESLAGALEIAKERLRWRSHAKMFALLVIVMASIVSSLSYTASADRDVNRQYETALSRYREQARQISELEKIAALETGIASMAANDAAMIDVVPRSRLLAEIARSMSLGVRLTAVSLDSGEPDASGAGNNVLLSGVAASDGQVAKLAAKLERDPDLHFVKLVSIGANPSSVKEPRKFEIAAVFETEARTIDAAGR
jgi:Tfp pilus assembly protein PilN